MVRVKEFATFFGLQVLHYSLLTYNFRMIAVADIPRAVLSDLLLAANSYILISRIANGKKSPSGMAGYVIGGGLGTVVGIWISKFI